MYISDVKKTQYGRKSALFISIKCISFGVVQNLLRLLVYHGADLSAKNAQNQRAVDLLPAESREVSRFADIFSLIYLLYKWSDKLGPCHYFRK